jgi:hypothetical protein
VPYIAEWLPVCNQHTYSRIFIKGERERGRRWTREIYVCSKGSRILSGWHWSIKNGHKGNENGGKLESWEGSWNKLESGRLPPYLIVPPAHPNSRRRGTNRENTAANGPAAFHDEDIAAHHSHAILYSRFENLLSLSVHQQTILFRRTYRNERLNNRMTWKPFAVYCVLHIYRDHTDCLFLGFQDNESALIMCLRSMYRITLRYYRATYKYSHFRIAALLYFSAVKGGGGDWWLYAIIRHHGSTLSSPLGRQ